MKFKKPSGKLPMFAYMPDLIFGRFAGWDDITRDTCSAVYYPKSDSSFSLVTRAISNKPFKITNLPKSVMNTPFKRSISNRPGTDDNEVLVLLYGPDGERGILTDLLKDEAHNFQAILEDIEHRKTAEFFAKEELKRVGKGTQKELERLKESKDILLSEPKDRKKKRRKYLQDDYDDDTL